ncbi:hypothetical protein TNCV_4495941 [Trichonephila clavipes]|nr:hypothetical protein TNCV_4495941 [Trichonephila clavipes]
MLTEACQECTPDGGMQRTYTRWRHAENVHPMEARGECTPDGGIPIMYTSGYMYGMYTMNNVSQRFLTQSSAIYRNTLKKKGSPYPGKSLLTPNLKVPQQSSSQHLPRKIPRKSLLTPNLKVPQQSSAIYRNTLKKVEVARTQEKSAHP